MMHPILAFLLIAAQEPAKESVEIPGTKLKFELVPLPGGKVNVGSPANDPNRKDDERQREVELKPFKIAAREVTWAEFNAFRNPKSLDGVTRPTNADSFFIENIPPDFRDGNRPMTNARWHTAMMYCEWLSKKTGGYYRLPTETEWEYAARAGSTAAGPDPLDDYAWHKKNSKERTHVGGERKSNAFGIPDMLGNVWEYVLEPYAPPEYGPVLRGGCWSSTARELRYANRQTIPYKWFADDSNSPRSVWWLTSSTVSIGFRVACVADPTDRADREAYATKIEIKIEGSKEKTITTGPSPAPYRSVTGEIRNAGDRALDEVELKIYYLEADGAPHLVDVASVKPGRAVFSKCWPVAMNSAIEGEVTKPLAPGATRKFALDLPLSYDIEDQPTPKIVFAGKVTGLRFAK
jgi:formylglycine-generating enzyme required for sulfatase activity